MKNALDLEKPQVGFVIDDGGDERPAVLRDTGNRIELSIVKHDEGQTLLQIVDDDNGENFEKDPQYGACIGFNADYAYTLINCEYSSSRASSGVGITTIIPEKVVTGVARKDLDTIDGMLTSMDGLSQWLGLSRFQWEQEDLKQTLTVEDTPEKEMGWSDGLSYGQKWFIQLRHDSAVVSNQVYLKTFLPDKSWSEHLRVHRLISELMSVADCRTHTYKDMKAYKARPGAALSRKIERDDWRDVLSYTPVVDRSAVDHETTFLFTYKDLSDGGVERWNELCSGCAQGMTILLYLIREFDNLAIETKAVLVGAILECVGWYSIVSNNDTKRMGTRKDRVTGEKRPAPPKFETLLEVLIESFEDDLPFKDINLWKDCIYDSYMGSKHPDARKMELDEMYYAVMEAIVLVRMWVGGQVGADLKTMKDRLSNDRIGGSLRPHIA